ncbi:hypothetical protein [Methylocella tundrae]|uniref:Uncharacterized protein n=1 Tax=Methylocella tundrae TaxID=227605 RepID=A0A4U8Z4S2_METTU|nr:hypothetical protein [Methylocella tundrae]WPP04206.1 hypothetical protein SIN04_17400 [Methylocella tundrae]VFU10490.1 conserved protein of unknown function [Methylocella tundrae]
MKLRFKTSITPKGIEIAWLRKSVLSWRPAPIEEWAQSEGRERVAAIHLQDLLDRDEAMALDCALLLPHSVAARLNSMIADAIGLPPVASLSANLAFEGRVEQRESLIRVRWFDRNLRVIIPQRIGAFLKWGSDEGRLSRQLFALMEAVDGFNASQGTEQDQRIKAWGPVQDALRQTTSADVSSDDYLAGLTIFQAGAFSLECRETGGGPAFRPILMSRSKASSLEDDAPVTEAEGEAPASDARAMKGRMRF